MSISSSDPVQGAWRRFSAIVLGGTAILLLSAFVFVAIVDPYDNLAFSPSLKRHRVTSNERFVFPGLVRRGRFDSAVFGTSTLMLLKPEALDAALGGRFANLAMSAGTAWEQTQMMDLFAKREGPPPQRILIGLDDVWCSADKPYPKLTPRPFPFWQYDNDRWNDYLHLLNTRAIGHAALQAATIIGMLEPRYSDDGYFQFTPDDSLYDLARARAKLYRPDGPQRATDIPLPAVGVRPAGWTFPDLDMLAEALDRFPSDTQKVLVFVPDHVAVFDRPNAWERFSHCKSAAVDIARSRTNVTVVDFLQPNALTMNDEAYWDSTHYRIGHVPEIIGALAEALTAEQDRGALFQVIWRRRK